MKYIIKATNEGKFLHSHKNYEIIVYTKGSGIFHSSGEDIEVCPGKFIIVPPGAEHCSTINGELERIYISGEFNQFFNLTSPTVISDNPEKEGLMLAKMIYTNRYSESEYVMALINAFTYFLLQNMKMEDKIFLAINDIIAQISNNFYDSAINLSAILKKSGYAEDYIRAHFKKVTGKTPIDFLTEIRIKHACYLIDTYKTSFSLADVSEKCGYTDYVYFSRRFKHIMGISPRKYMDEN